MIQYGRYVVIAILLLVIQATVVPFIALAGVTPDLLLIYVVIIALRKGQITGTVAGFTIGIATDVVSGDFLGLGALAKTIAGFVAGYFYNELNPEHVLVHYRFLFVIAVAGLVHSIVYYAFLLQGLPVSVTDTLFRYMIGSTVYTLFLSLIPYFHYHYRTRAVLS